MEVPEAFIEWWTQNAASNVDLASLSNVNRKWRNVVMRSLLNQVEESVERKNSSTPSSSSASLLLLPSMLRAIMLSNSDHKPSDDETFCAAWFHPAGIQIQQLNTPSDMWDEGESDMFAPSGVPFYAGSEEEGASRALALKSPRGGRTCPLLQKERPLCSHEWRGYRNPMDVLEPFGYAAYFVEAMLTQAKGRAFGEANGETRDMSHYHDDETLSDLRPDVKTTIAVRGATLARPEGYCLCWDASDAAIVTSISKDSWKAETQEGFLRSIMMRKRRHQILQSEVLPRVLLSSKHKNPLNVEMESKQLPCLQFLNASGSNAVRLFTPPFECGPLEGPITLFLVGIATEDGCFVSGLKRRCELGHMHPLNLRDAMIDMSPVCIATDYRRNHPHRSGSPSESLLASRSFSGKSGSGSGADSDESSCAVDSNREERMQCKCDFGEAATQSWNEDDEEPPEECVWRGQRGPGLWHCYVCVFDKEDSVIRIDGAPEPLEKGCCHNSPPAATLDGLTIGSDHCFDMSLCLGDASTDEGEGAIAELAVFKGRLADADIKQLECYLMHKHGITKFKSSERATLVRQDEWKRQGRALIAQPPPWSMRVSTGIPLPIMARDRDVAWHRINAVTGKDVRVARIGSKFSNGSSDW